MTGLRRHMSMPSAFLLRQLFLPARNRSTTGRAGMISRIRRCMWTGSDARTTVACAYWLPSRTTAKCSRWRLPEGLRAARESPSMTRMLQTCKSRI